MATGDGAATGSALLRALPPDLMQTQQRANDRIDAALREWNEPK
ncbi:hypothetical protein [Streptomyces sp. NPDC048438]